MGFIPGMQDMLTIWELSLCNLPYQQAKIGYHMIGSIDGGEAF